MCQISAHRLWLTTMQPLKPHPAGSWGSDLPRDQCFLPGRQTLPEYPTLFSSTHLCLGPAAKTQVVARRSIGSAKSGGCIDVSETRQRVVALLPAAMILLQPMVQIAATALVYLAA